MVVSNLFSFLPEKIGEDVSSIVTNSHVFRLNKLFFWVGYAPSSASEEDLVSDQLMRVKVAPFSGWLMNPHPSATKGQLQFL